MQVKVDDPKIFIETTSICICARKAGTCRFNTNANHKEG